MKIPFMFGVRRYDGDDHAENPIVKWIVYMAEWDYKTQNCVWMMDRDIGNYPLVPSVDLVCAEWAFKIEKEALQKMRELWASIEG